MAPLPTRGKRLLGLPLLPIALYRDRLHLGVGIRATHRIERAVHEIYVALRRGRTGTDGCGEQEQAQSAHHDSPFPNGRPRTGTDGAQTVYNAPEFRAIAPLKERCGAPG